jgi:hypothetical protein
VESMSNHGPRENTKQRRGAAEESKNRGPPKGAKEREKRMEKSEERRPRVVSEGTGP